MSNLQIITLIINDIIKYIQIKQNQDFVLMVSLSHTLFINLSILYPKFSAKLQ